MLTAITLYNLSVQLETQDSRLQQLADNFIKTFYTSVTEGFGVNAEPIVKTFATTIPKYNVFYFTNTQFKHFNVYLKGMGYTFKDYEFINKRDYEHIVEDYKVRDGWVLREEQEPVAEFIEECVTGTRLLPLATGSGKTFIALNSLGRLKNRFAIVIMPTFIDKWIEDVQEIHKAEDKDIVVIRGAKAIRDVAENMRDGVADWKYYIFSLPTLRNFNTDFENNPRLCEEKYGVTPLDLFPLLGIHTMLVDEVHLSFHAVYKLLLLSNVKFLLGLSATMIPNDALEARAYNSVFSDENTYHDSMIKKYIKLFPMTYNADNKALSKMRWSSRRNKFNRSSGVYSHAMFEQSIMKYKSLLKSYFKVIEEPFDHYYLGEYLPEDKCIIFVYTVEMATLLKDYLSNKYPDKVVKRYVQDDSYDEMLTGDVIVTTIGSAGTGLDIPNLRVGIQTVSVSSPKSNIQSMGRLRKLKDRDVKFIYLYCAQVDKQVGYHKLRLELFQDRVAQITRVRCRQNLTLENAHGKGNNFR